MKYLRLSNWQKKGTAPIQVLVALVLFVLVASVTTTFLLKNVRLTPYTEEKNVEWNIAFQHLCEILQQQVAEGGECNPDSLKAEIPEGSGKWYTLTEITQHINPWMSEEEARKHIENSCCKIGESEESGGESGITQTTTVAPPLPWDEKIENLPETSTEPPLPFGEEETPAQPSSPPAPPGVPTPSLPETRENVFSKMGIAFCLDAHPEDFYDAEHISTAIDALKELDAKFIRIDLNWKDIEPKEGVWDENKLKWYRNLIEKFHENGIGVILVLAAKERNPAWIGTLKNRDYKKFLEELENLGRKVGEEYGDLVDYYQLSNEENALPLFVFWIIVS